MNFVAIDFETANEKRSSPCSIGLAVIEDGKVKEKIHYLIKPKEMIFRPINIGIHGIRPAMVENEREFDSVFEDIRKYFENSLIVAHNAGFDISVLRKTAELYNIELPSFDYICTMKLAKNFYPALDNVKLNTVNDFLGYKFKHHDALFDALACSNILLNISKELKTDNINDIAALTGVSIGYVDGNDYKPSSNKGRPLKTSSKIYHYSRKEEPKLNYNSFEDEVVVFTGRLQSMTRDKAIRIVRNLNGTAGGTVTKKTTILVSNMKDIKGLRREEMSNKFKKATDYKAKGQHIQFLNEEEFLLKAGV